MTSQELAATLLKQAETIAPSASVIVFVCVETTGGYANSRNADHWDKVEAIKLLADRIAKNIGPPLPAREE